MADRWSLMLVGDELARSLELQSALRAAGAEVRTAPTASEAIAALLEDPCELALVDLELPGESGLALLQHLRADHGSTPVMLVAADPAERERAFGLGADDFLIRPLDGADLVARANRRRVTHQALLDVQAQVAKLRELAVTDGLTRVANHRHFQERLREEFRRAQRYDDPLALILIDLDHFKAVNDTFGHQGGDQVLLAVAGAIKEAVRETDFVARYGGEEFAVLLPKTHLAGALTVAERIMACMKRVVVGSTGHQVTGSFGVSGFPGRSVSTPEQLIRTADEALFRAKKEGRNKISLFQASLLAAAS